MKALRMLVVLTLGLSGVCFAPPARSEPTAVTMGEMFQGAVIHCPLQQEAVDMVEAFALGGTMASEAVFQQNNCQFSPGAYLPMRVLSRRTARGYAISIVLGTRVEAMLIADGEVTQLHAPYFIILMENLNDMHHS